MFWMSNYGSSPHIEALLNKEDVTLQELMDQEDILQECRSQNKKLVEYLTKSEVMEELVILTTKEPPMDTEERFRYKYPNVACELLTCDVPTMNEKLAGDETLLAKLYSFIDTDQPLNPLLASFFSKTIGVLITRKSDQNWYSYQFTCLQVLEFLKSRQTCVDLLLQHIETSAIMDLVLKLVTQVEGQDTRQNILNWLDSQQLVQRLVKLLSPNSEPSKHANAAQLLCDMITVIREYQRTSTKNPEPDPILNTLESENTVSLLLETILTGEKLESSIVGGIQVLLALLGQKLNNAMNKADIHGNGAVEEVMDNEQRIKISNATLLYLPQLHKLLLDPPYKPPVKTTSGLLECPVGNTRLHVAQLISALLTTENVKIYETLVDLETFQTLLDLFFKYTWNNFLHTQVQQCLALAISCDYKDANDIIYANIFIKCKLIERILEAWDKNDTKQNKENGVRQGYMGHLINIANNIVSQCQKCEGLEKFLKTNLSSETLGKWEALETQLSIINVTHQIALGGQSHEFMTNSEGNPDEYHSYAEEAYLQQLYSSYHGQQITPQFIENFGFNDDKFNDVDDSLNISVELTTLDFNLSEEDLDKQEDMFNKVCQQKLKAGLEDCGGQTEWGDEGELTFQTVVEKRDWPAKQQQNDSNSSDEDEEDPRDIHMDIDVTDPWDSAEPLPVNNVLPEVNPWDVVPAEPVESTGWANFDNFESSVNIENTVIVENKTTSNEGSNAGTESNQNVPAVPTTLTTPVVTSITGSVATAPTVTAVIESCQEEEREKTPDTNKSADRVSEDGDGLKPEDTASKAQTVSSDEDSNVNNQKAEKTSDIVGTDTNANPNAPSSERISDSNKTEPPKDTADGEKSEIAEPENAASLSECKPTQVPTPAKDAK